MVIGPECTDPSCRRNIAEGYGHWVDDFGCTNTGRKLMDELSRRDLFAMAALQGILAGPTMIKAHDLAKQSYQIADAMIWESAKEHAEMGCPIDPPEETEHAEV